MGLLACPCCHIPNNLVDLVVFKLIKNAIGSDHCVVKVVDTALLIRGLRIARDNASHPTKMRKLGLTVAKCPTDGKTTGEDTIWTNERVFFLITIFLVRYRLLSDLLRSCGRHTVFHHSLGLVDVASCLHDSIELALIRGLMISR